MAYLYLPQTKIAAACPPNAFRYRALIAAPPRSPSIHMLGRQPMLTRGRSHKHTRAPGTRTATGTCTVLSTCTVPCTCTVLCTYTVLCTCAGLHLDGNHLPAHDLILNAHLDGGLYIAVEYCVAPRPSFSLKGDRKDCKQPLRSLVPATAPSARTRPLSVV